MKLSLSLLYLLSVPLQLCSATTSSPFKLSPDNGNSEEQCPDFLAVRNSIRATLNDAISSTINPGLNGKYGRVCNCGGEGWVRAAYINMSDLSHECPTNWTFYDSNNIRGCSRQNATQSCFSALFTIDRTYSSVCGRILAYQRGDPDAFLNILNRKRKDIDISYVDGVSVTYGYPRKHIWTFASADNGTGNTSSHSCSCIHSNIPWPHLDSLPSFMGNNYFCDLGFGPNSTRSTVYLDPLWDGEGCTYPNSCCQFNNPPWFCVSLPEATEDAIEVRLCLSETVRNEDIIINLVDIYVR